VPSNGAVSVALSKDCCALFSESVADCTLVWSAATCALDAPAAWSSLSFACAYARLACAELSDDASCEESRVART
jgi:hypothetical protein